MDELDKLKKLANAQKREKAKIEGRIESLIEDLQEHGYESVDAAKKDIKVIGSKLKKMKTIFNKKLTEFKEKYAEELQKVS